MEANRLVRFCRFLLVCGGITSAALSTISVYAQSHDQTPAAAQAQDAPSAAAARISGTVQDTNGDVLEGARVELSKTDSPAILRQVDSGAMGQFEFTGLEPGTYVVMVVRNGMSAFVSKPIVLQPGASAFVPNVMLRVAPVTTSVMVMDKEAASVQQVRIAEQQRVLKVFPNFYSSFDWNAPPMLPKQKYSLAARTLIDPVSFLTTGAIAGVEQYRNIFPGFGSGMEGYSKRYGAAYLTFASGELLTRAVLPSVFHADPRYFVMGKGSTRARAFHAISSTFVTRGDNGSRKVNFPEIVGDLSAAALSNVYYPASERGASLVFINGFGNIGGNMLGNLIREFVLNRMTTRVKHRLPSD